MALKDPKKVAATALAQLNHDRDERLVQIDQYLHGNQADPYVPENATDEYRSLVNRCKTNVMPLIVGSSTQAMYVDSFRRGRSSGESRETIDARTRQVQPEWDHWQRSGLDAGQTGVYRAALAYGHSFTLTEKGEDGKVRTKGLSPLRTVALYEDAASDVEPYVTLYVRRFPKAADKDGERERGKAYLWDDKYRYEVEFKSMTDPKSVTVGKGVAHGATSNPVTRFTCTRDLDGRTVGVVEPMIPIQDRINQDVFDLLVVQSYGSFKVRTVSGMTPPMKMKPVDDGGNEVLNPAANEDQIADWVPVINPETGRPMADEIQLNAKRMFFARDHETKFGTLDETPLEGFIQSIELAFQHMAALSQTPPHHLLGQIANVSAEALQAAEASLARKVEEFKSSFGESWERVFRVAAEIGGYEGADDWHGEVLWRDMDNAALVSAADALVKMREIGIPNKGLWARVPGVTANELAEWEDLAEKEDEKANLVATVRQQAATSRPTFRQVANQEQPEDEAIA